MKQLKLLLIICFTQILLINHNLNAKSKLFRKIRKKATNIGTKVTKKSYNYFSKTTQKNNAEKKEPTRTISFITNLINTPITNEINQYIQDLEEVLKEKTKINNNQITQKLDELYKKLVDIKSDLNEIEQIINQINNS